MFPNEEVTFSGLLERASETMNLAPVEFAAREEGTHETNGFYNLQPEGHHTADPEDSVHEELSCLDPSKTNGGL